jgi:hypothetical protein
MSAKELKAKRVNAGISGHLVCLKTGIGRSRLSDIERGYVTATEKESEVIQKAIEELIEAREKVTRVATEVGWPVGLF